MDEVRILPDVLDVDIHQSGEKEELNSDGDCIFIETLIILCRGKKEFFWDVSPQRQGRIILSEVRPKVIPTDQLLPYFSENSSLSVCTDSIAEKHYIKGPGAINYTPKATEVYGIRDLMLQEAQICEVLRSNSHPNIAQYHGCVRSGNWIVGLCFTHYNTILREYLVNDSASPLHRGKCFERIKAGIKHLHTLDLVHTDLTLDNIMIDDEDNPRIIDFDASRKRGMKLGIKYGDIEESQVTAKFKTDEIALVRICKELGIDTRQ